MKYHIERKFIKDCENAGIDWQSEIKAIHGEDVEIIPYSGNLYDKNKGA